MKLSRLFLSLIGLLPLLTQASQDLAKAQHQQRNLAILLDLTNEESTTQWGLGPIQRYLVCEILSKQSCILTTATTLQQLVNVSHTNTPLAKLAAMLKKSDAQIVPWLENRIKEANKALDGYEIYSDGFFTVLLPKPCANEYKKSVHLLAAGLNQIDTPKPGASVFKNKFHSFCQHANVVWKSGDFLTLLNNLLMRQDGIAWDILMLGHGNTHGVTCGLTKSAFKQILNFLATKLHTRVFAYTSCYAGGKMTDYIYADNAKYPYLILCKGLGENRTGEDIMHSQSVFSALSHIKNTHDAQEIAECLPRQSKPLSAFIKYLNIYQIRLPESSSFILPDLKNSNGTIATFYVDKHTAAKQLKNPPAIDIILNTPNINTVLTLDQKSNLYSALKGNSVHYLAKIEAPTLDSALFAKKLHHMTSLNPYVPQTFLFKKVICKDSSYDNYMVFLNAPQTFPMKPQPFTLFWKQRNGEAYKMGGDFMQPNAFKSAKLSKQQTNAYLNQFEQLRKTTEKVEEPPHLMDFNYWRQLKKFKSTTVMCAQAGLCLAVLNTFYQRNVATKQSEKNKL